MLKSALMQNLLNQFSLTEPVLKEFWATQFNIHECFAHGIKMELIVLGSGDKQRGIQNTVKHLKSRFFWQKYLMTQPSQLF